jgi:serine/threonine protein kinase
MRCSGASVAAVWRSLQSSPSSPVTFRRAQGAQSVHDDDPSNAQRFLREADIGGSLSHPNIVTVHDYFEHESTP